MCRFDASGSWYLADACFPCMFLARRCKLHASLCAESMAMALLVLLHIAMHAADRVRTGCCFGATNRLEVANKGLPCEHTAGFDTAEGTTVLLRLMSYLLLGVLLGVLLGSNILRTVPQAGRLSLHSCILKAILLSCMLLVILAEAR